MASLIVCMSLMYPSFTSIPAPTLPSACPFLYSITISISVYGITSRALAYTQKQCESNPAVFIGISCSRSKASVLAAPPHR